METNVIYNEECLEGMEERIPDNSIDMVLADLPYRSTECSWDSIIPLEPLWEQYKRIIRDNGAIVLTASGKFAPKLKMSNFDWFKYELIWEKTKAGNFIQAKNMPLKLHENICVFSSGVVIHEGQSQDRMTYNPQGVDSVNKKWSRPKVYDSEHKFKRPSHKKKGRSTLKISLAVS